LQEVSCFLMSHQIIVVMTDTIENDVGTNEGINAS
jgi:hypothetical protein